MSEAEWNLSRFPAPDMGRFQGRPVTVPAPNGGAVPAPDRTEEQSIPDWVRVRQTGAANTLGFVPPKRDKALPLDPEQISNAFEEKFGHVIETRELPGDVWFVRTAEPNDQVNYTIILYEHMGEWECSSITRTPWSASLDSLTPSWYVDLAPYEP